MRKNIHPTYGPVMFKDIHTGDEMLTQSTLGSPTLAAPKIIPVEISRHSHPVYTGSASAPQTGSAIEKFWQRFGTKHQKS